MIIIYLFFGLVCLLAAWFLIKSRGLSNGALPIIFISVGAIHYLIPLSQYLDPSNYRFAIYSFNAHIESLLYASLYIFILVLSISFLSNINLFSSSKPSFNQNFEFPNNFGRGAAIAIISIQLLVIFFYLSLLSSYDVGDALRNRIELFRGLGGIVTFSQGLPILALVLCLTYSLPNYRKLILYLIFYGIFFLIVYSLMGSRNTFIIFVLTAFLIRFIVFKDISFLEYSFYILLAFITILVLSLIGYYRIRLGGEVSGFVFGEEVNQVMVNSFGNHEILLWLVENKNDWEAKDGGTFAASVANFVPRAIWPDKPFGGGPEITNLIYPGKYYSGGFNLTSFTTGIIAESYLNFKWLGLIVAPMHALFAKICLSYWNRKNSIIDIVGHSFTILSFTFLIFYSEFLGWFARYFLMIAPLVLVKLFDRVKHPIVKQINF